MKRVLLLTNVTLAGRTGTEVVTRDLAAGLAARGHHVSVYAPALGAIAAELRDRGVQVCARVSDITTPPDLVHGHHFVETVEALQAFPAARGIFVCHDRTAAHSIPPRLARVAAYVAVDRYCLQRLTDDWAIPPAQTRVILNAVDLSRVHPRGPLPTVPRRALVFSHNAAPGSHLDVVRSACAAAGLDLDVMGAGSGTESDRPEEILGRYDIVFAKARCALEAMAAGCAVILCDVGGIGGMVTTANCDELRTWNFGAHTLRDPLDAGRLTREVGRYNAQDAAGVSAAIRRQSSLDEALEQYERLYDEVLAAPRPPANLAGETRSLLEPLAQRIRSLEHQLSESRKAERMDGLGDDDVRQVHIAIDRLPDRFVAGQPAFVRVRLRNGLSDRAIGSWPPYPIQWGYRWRSVDDPGFTDAECERTPIHPPVQPGTEAPGSARVIAPASPGRYVLRLTLVQEYLQWLDRAAAPILDDVDVTVQPVSRSSSTRRD